MLVLGAFFLGAWTLGALAHSEFWTFVIRHFPHSPANWLRAKTCIRSQSWIFARRQKTGTARRGCPFPHAWKSNRTCSKNCAGNCSNNLANDRSNNRA